MKRRVWMRALSPALFELCERLQMQLIIAAENISPEKGTTYKLVRKSVSRILSMFMLSGCVALRRNFQKRFRYADGRGTRRRELNTAK